MRMIRFQMHYFLKFLLLGRNVRLRKPEDFEKAVGKHVFVTTMKPMNGSEGI